MIATQIKSPLDKAKPVFSEFSSRVGRGGGGGGEGGKEGWRFPSEKVGPGCSSEDFYYTQSEHGSSLII